MEHGSPEWEVFCQTKEHDACVCAQGSLRSLQSGGFGNGDLVVRVGGALPTCKVRHIEEERREAVIREEVIREESIREE